MIETTQDRCVTYDFWTNAAGERFRIAEWPSSTSADLALIVVHGHGEHIGRYQRLASALADLPIPMIGYDHRGHGESTGYRGDAAGMDGLVDDLLSILPELLSRTGQARCLLFGHSMGGLTVARLLATRQVPSSIVAACISAPAFTVNRTWKVSAKVAIGRLVAWFAPTMRFSTGLDPFLVSRDRDLVEEYRRDPLVHRLISARLGRSLIDDGEQTSLLGAKVSIPTFVYHGTDDRIASIEGTRRFVNAMADHLVEYREWDGYFHEPHHEPADLAEAVFEAIRNWIKASIEQETSRR